MWANVLFPKWYVRRDLIIQGKYLGIAFTYGIPSQGVYPLVGIDVSGTVEANFGQEPFMLDVERYAIIPLNERAGSQNIASNEADIFVSSSSVKLENLPEVLLAEIFDYAVTSPKTAMDIGRQNKKFFQIITSLDSLWERLAGRTFLVFW